MANARTIIRNCLTFSLNRLSPGEAEDADLFGRCLDALGSIVDEMNGGKGLLWREMFSVSSAITGTTAQLGVAWAGLASGDEILGATIQYPGAQDLPMAQITMGQYEAISVKSTGGTPSVWAHDGAATVFFWPAATGQTVTLRTKQAAQTFADLDTNYIMPAGYQSYFEKVLAEAMAPTLNPQMLVVAERKATAARRRIAAQAIAPAILEGNRRAGSILVGWN